MSGLRCWLAGEGKHELGDYELPAQYRSNPPQPGVLFALLQQVSARGWSVQHGCRWKDLRHFRVGAALKGEADEKNVLILALRAKESGCDTLVFSRDSDGDQKRVEAIEKGISRAGQQFPEVRVIGGAAVPAIEGWVLGVRGERRTEQTHRQKLYERLLELGCSTTEEMVDMIARTGWAQLADDAGSLRLWRERATEVLGAE